MSKRLRDKWIQVIFCCCAKKKEEQTSLLQKSYKKKFVYESPEIEGKDIQEYQSK